MKLNSYLLLVLLFTVFQIHSTNYYVSNETGDDFASGAIDAPFLTIQKAADVMSVGDNCYILGGVYRETVTVKDNNVTFQNFNNEKVIVSGTQVLSNWTTYQNGIYKADFSGAETDFTMLFVDFVRQQMARWPNNTTGDMMDPLNINSGYTDCRVYEGVQGQASRKATFDHMPSFPDDFFVGGIFRGITGKKWINPMGYITASKGNELTVDAITGGWKENSEKTLNNNGSGHGFIFHLNALDIENEWFHKDGQIYYMPPSGKNPNNMDIEVKKREWGFVINNRSGVVIDGIDLHASSIQLKNSNSCTVQNSSAQYLMPFLTRSGYGASYTAHGGIYIKGDNNVFKNCYIGHSWGNGFSIEDGNNNTIDNCYIEDVGWIAQFTSNIQNNGFNTIVKNSTFGSSGRFHIRTNKKINITYNDFYDCMKMGQDAGSIQCTNGSDWGNAIDMQGAEIAYNRIHDCTTLTNGTKQFVLAFYLEGCYNYTVHHNLVYNFITDIVPDGTFAYLGPRKSRIENCYYYNNTVWNVNWGVRLWNRDREGEISNVRFWNNIIDKKANDDVGVDLYQDVDFQNNYKEMNTTQQNSLFVDADSGDFRLKSGVGPIDSGREISGITLNVSGVKPDIGAIEYGSNFPDVGSDLNPSDYVYDSNKQVLKTLNVKNTVEYNIYPSPTRDYLNIEGQFNKWKIYSLKGELLLEGTEEKINLTVFSSGIYFIAVDDVYFDKIIKK